MHPFSICVSRHRNGGREMKSIWKGISMVQHSHDLDCQYKTAVVLAHKQHEAIIAREVQAGEVLKRHVEIDGAYFGGLNRPPARRPSA